jgi:hypothetical protein
MGGLLWKFKIQDSRFKTADSKLPIQDSRFKISSEMGKGIGSIFNFES